MGATLTHEQSRSSERGDLTRYRALLKVSGSVGPQQTVEAVIHTVADLLSNVVSFDSIGLLLLDASGQRLTLRALEQGHQESGIEIGMEFPYAGTGLGRALDEQVPVFVPDVRRELSRYSELASRSSPVASVYIFPVSTPRTKLGALVFSRKEKLEFTPADVELMRSIAAHLSVALENAVAISAAEGYQRELARERDRLSLLLQINNHIVTNLDINDLFRAASASIRKHFANDFTSFMLFEEHSDRLKTAVLDFPGSRGFMGEIPVTRVAEDDLEQMRARRPEIISSSDAKLPPVIAEMLRAESICSLAVLSLVGATRPIGAMVLGSRKENSFSQADLDLLSQVSSQISLAIDNALAYGRLTESRDQLEEQRVYLESEISSEYNFEDIVGKSAAFQKVLEQVSIVSPTDSTVLLHGETGTGKELIARAIHNLSGRRQRTFVRLNCAAIPSGLLESELFGHEKGAFTGALMQKKGRFELADGGSLFLDEIGDISLELQPKLLRALQEQEFERLGSAKTIHVNVRIIAATHRDLSEMIRQGTFREDLFYRLSVFPIEIPPLRERRQDIPLLVNYFASKLSRRMRKQISSIPRQAMDILTNCPWKGNVRELANFIERAVILSHGEQLEVPISELQSSYSRDASLYPSSFREAERNVIVEALKSASGQISGNGGAAERLGLKRTTLQNKMRRLGITSKDYRS
ncbi:MAG TPA: sigma 54-interacting transcriptional regulator [Terriglobales bacterium]|nr:sigma 54-interacting transcriptional regulator [Terriglobales bacterium]